MGGDAPYKEALGVNTCSNEVQNVVDKAREEANKKVQDTKEKVQELMDEGCKPLFSGSKMTRLGLLMQFLNIVANHGITNTRSNELLRFLKDDICTLDNLLPKIGTKPRGGYPSLAGLYEHPCKFE